MEDSEISEGKKSQQVNEKKVQQGKRKRNAERISDKNINEKRIEKMKIKISIEISKEEKKKLLNGKKTPKENIGLEG